MDIRDVTFLRGRAGVCALGAVVANSMGDDKLKDYYLAKFNETPIVKEIISNGRKLGGRRGSPLMLKWNGKQYWGAAHGLSGIMYILMHFEIKPNERKMVKKTLLYMIKNRFPSGNYRACEEDESDVLVHWCHGAPGIALTLLKAAQVFGDKVFLQAAADAAMKVVWKRGLLKHAGICHGISGNAYVFSAHYRVAGDPKSRFKAKAFTCFLLDGAQRLMSKGEMRGGDSPYSLFEGVGGMAYLFLDMVQPATAKFPGFDM